MLPLCVPVPIEFLHGTLAGSKPGSCIPTMAVPDFNKILVVATLYMCISFADRRGPSTKGVGALVLQWGGGGGGGGGGGLWSEGLCPTPVDQCGLLSGGLISYTHLFWAL